MEQKRKRFRPSLTDYRKLEKENAELKAKLKSHLDCNGDIAKDSDLLLEKYRELQAKFESQLDGTSMLVKDCDGWRDLYRELFEKYKHCEAALAKQNEACERMSKQIDKGIAKSVEIAVERGDVVYISTYNACEQSNKYAEQQIANLKSERDELEHKLSEALSDFYLLKNRGFWARVFNK